MPAPEEMQTSLGSRQPPGAGEQQRCPAIRQRLTKLFRKREDFHATERAAGGKPAGYGFGGDGRHINSVGPASLAQHPVAVTQNKRVKGFFFIIIVSVRVISPRRVAGRSAVSFSVMPALLLYPPGGVLRFPAPEIAIRAVHSLSHNACSAVISRVSSRSTGTVTSARSLSPGLSVPSPGRLTRPTQAVVLPV